MKCFDAIFPELLLSGEPHNPSFTAMVLIDGACYKGAPCSTKKFTEGKVARVAYITIMGNGDAEEENVVAIEPNIGSYKTALQEYTHKRRWLHPQYEVTMEGDPHFPSFIATVVVNGFFFKGEPSSKKKEVEGKVAKIALLTLLSTSETTKETIFNDDAHLPSFEMMEQKLVIEACTDTLSYEYARLPTSKDQRDLTFYKGFLHRYTQTNKLPIPIYSITMTGEPQNPSFTATVLIDDACHKGAPCSTKKIVQGKAARVAYITIMGLFFLS